MVIAQGSVWVVLMVPVWREVVALYRAVKPSLFIWVVPTLVVAALLLLLVYSPATDYTWPLYGHQVKTRILTAAAALTVALPAIFGICLIQDQVRRHKPKMLSVTDIGRAVIASLQMRRLLGVAGAIIGLAVLASGALQRATVPAYIPETAFPPSAIVLYGAFFTGLLILVYLPAHLSLRRFCVDIRNNYYPVESVPEPSSQEFSTWIDRRNQLDTLTQVNISLSQQLQASLFILAPLISAVIGVVPKG